MFLCSFQVRSLSLVFSQRIIRHIQQSAPIWRRRYFSSRASLPQGNFEPQVDEPVPNRRKLFIKNLKFNTKEDDLREHFSSFGEIEEVEFPVTKNTRKCKGFAFITFCDEYDATRALGHLHQFKGRVLIVEYASCNLPAESYNKNVICVKNIPTDITREQVIAHFSAFGEVLNVDFPLNYLTLERRPFCFVHFIHDKEADEATKTQFQTLNSSTLEIRKSRCRRSPTFTDRIVVYPPLETTVDYIKNYFEKFGKVLSVVLKLVHLDSTSAPRLVAMVLFDNNSTVLKVLNQFHVMNGKAVSVIRGDPNAKFQTTADLRVFVEPMPLWISDREVKEYFSQFGFVTSCYFLTDPKTGGKCNWCLVSFNSVPSVNRTIRKSQHVICGEVVRVHRKGWRSEELRSEMKTSSDLSY